ncbi:hypothetical protein KNE206_25720 [Kitasatospora sp. NE20-6]|uniref:hypothetical protein n=1 Tax=Kitasatospora sp. NE20-6 TaxID=2859066 RepID=UPI0034DC2306
MDRTGDDRRPGAAFGHHVLVIGALTGEEVRRATGRTLQELYEERVRAAATGSHRLPGIASNRNRPDSGELQLLPNHGAVRAKGPAEPPGPG